MPPPLHKGALVRVRAISEKILLTLLTFSFFFFGYHFVAKITSHRAVPFPLALPFERDIPLVPEMVYAYLLALVLPDVAIVAWPLADLHGMRRQALAYCVLFALAFGIFLLYPVHQDLRPQVLPQGSLALQILGAYYAYDPPVNLFPSLHCGNAVLAALLCKRISQRLYLVVAPLAGLVLVSVLLVKQHYLADVISGVFLATLADRLCFFGWQRPADA